MKKKIILTAAILLGIALGLCACQRGKTAEEADVKNSSADKIKLVYWHYYNDAQKEPLDKLVDEYNATVGAEKNVEVEAYSQGSIIDLEGRLNLVLSGSINDSEMANIFLGYRDMISNIERKYPDKLVNAETYLSSEELARYNQAYLKEGYIDGKLYILPVAKSTELLLMNQTRLDEFLEENRNYSKGDLTTWEGIEKLAKGYYEWTDAKTPGIPGDGAAFMGLDSLANYFIAMNHSLGSDIYEYDSSGKLVLKLDEAIIKKLFLNYYIPYTMGYYGAKGKYRSDDLKQSYLAGYVGSSSSTLYFPDEVEDGNGSMEPVELGVYPYPVIKNGRKTAIQQGAGIAIYHKSEAEDKAAVDFVRWLTFDKGFEMASAMSYMPVGSGGITPQQEAEITNSKVFQGIKVGLEQSETYDMVYGFDFDGASDVRSSIERGFMGMLQEGRQEFKDSLAQGKTMEEAAADMDYEGKAERFYQQIEAMFAE